MGRPRGLGFIGMGLALLVCGQTLGHEFRSPRADHLRIGPTHIRIELRYDIEAGRDAEELRALHDRDGNGWLDGAEQGHLLAYLELAATHFLKITLDGEALPMTVVARRAGPMQHPLPSVRQLNATFALEGVMPASDPAEARTLALIDRAKDSGFPVLISVAAEGGEILESGYTEAGGIKRSLELPLPEGVPVLRGIVLRKSETLVVRFSMAQKTGGGLP